MFPVGDGPVLGATSHPGMTAARDAVLNWLVARTQGRDLYLESAADDYGWLKIDWREPPEIELEPALQTLRDQNLVKEGRLEPHLWVLEDPLRGEIKTRTLPGFLDALRTVLRDEVLGTSLRLRDFGQSGRTATERLLAESLGLKGPTVVHLAPLVVSDTVSLEQLRRGGWLWEAVLSHLATRGWKSAHGGEQVTRVELLTYFGMDGLQAAPAAWDVEQLEIHQLKLLRELTPAELIEQSRPFWPAPREFSEHEHMRLEGLALLVGEELSRLSEFPEKVAFFFQAPPTSTLRHPGLRPLIQRLEELVDWDSILLDEVLSSAAAPSVRAICETTTGDPSQAYPAEVMALLGRELCLSRLSPLTE